MTRLWGTAIALLLSTAAVLAAQPAINADAALLADFTKRINQYIDVRKAADAGTPALKKTDDPAHIRIAQQQLAERIRAARASAKHGDVFTPAIAAHFRRLLRPEAKEPGTKAAIADDKPAAGTVAFKVNASYPDKEPLSTVPPNVLQSLPKLPDDVEYRFVGKHLVLRDSRANLIIDYITDAIA